MTLTLVHTADWQIGSQFGRIGGDPAAALRAQRIDTVRRIAQYAAKIGADAVLVAGDVFDDNAVADETLRRTVLAMAPFSGQWVLLPGNHDYAGADSVWRRLRRLNLLGTNIQIADSPEILSLCDGKLAVLPAPLLRRHEAVDLTAWFDSAMTGSEQFRIGLAHGSVASYLPENASVNNPISERRAETARLDYLALGDWHSPLEIQPRIWYSGTPETDRFRNRDAGHCLKVSIASPGEVPVVERVRIGQYRWREISKTLQSGTDGSLATLDDLLAGDSTSHTDSGTPANDTSRDLVRLKLGGVLSLAERQALDELLENWRARLHYLEVDERALHSAPAAADLEAMGATGFVAEALQSLMDIAASEQHAQQADAALALQILYREQLALRGS